MVSGDCAESGVVGSVVASRYRIVRPIGAGGVACVYEAHDQEEDQTVAIKVLRSFLTADPAIVARFELEARAASDVDHDNVVRVLGWGAGPPPYMVMELVDGSTLAELLAQEGAQSVARAVPVVLQVLAGVEALHNCGVVHRDLKPGNVLMATDGTVKVFDLGLVMTERTSLRPPRARSLTPEGMAMGTPAYCSPEQIAGSPRKDLRTDIYAVGLILFEMLTGDHPFPVEDFTALCEHILRSAPPPTTVFVQGVPEALERVVQRALAKDPSDRFESAIAMAQAIEAACEPGAGACEGDLL